MSLVTSAATKNGQNSLSFWMTLAGIVCWYGIGLMAAKIGNALYVRRRAFPSLAITKDVSNLLEAT